MYEDEESFVCDDETDNGPSSKSSKSSDPSTSSKSSKSTYATFAVKSSKRDTSTSSDTGSKSAHLALDNDPISHVFGRGVGFHIY